MVDLPNQSQQNVVADLIPEMLLRLSLVGNQGQPTVQFTGQMPVMSLVTVGRMDQ